MNINEDLFYITIGFASLTILFNLYVYTKMLREIKLIKQRFTIYENINRITIESPRGPEMPFTNIKMHLLNNGL